MGQNNKLITKAGEQKLRDELSYRINELRQIIADKIDDAKKQGDLSENAAYTSALEDYQLNEARISQINDELAQSTIVENKSGDDKVHIGDKVEIKDIQTGQVTVYTVGGENEADPRQGKISSNSPLGKALLGKEKGQEFSINLPLGEKKYKVVKVY